MRKNQLSKKYNIDARTIDYYSNVVKILPYTQNSGSNNYRNYDENSERILKQILILRELGLSINAIKDKLNNPMSFSYEWSDFYIAELEKKREEELQRINKLIGYAEEFKRESILTKEEKERIFNEIYTKLVDVDNFLRLYNKAGKTEEELINSLKECLDQYSSKNDLKKEA